MEKKIKVSREFAAYIIDKFEEFLEAKGVQIDCEDKEGDEGEAIIFGSDYDELMEGIVSTAKEFGIEIPDTYEPTEDDEDRLYTWSELCDRADGAAHLSPELKAKDNARGEITELCLDYLEEDVDAAECPEDFIERICNTYSIRFLSNGSIDWTQINGWTKTDDMQYCRNLTGGVYEMIDANSAYPKDVEGEVFVINEPAKVDMFNYSPEDMQKIYKSFDIDPAMYADQLILDQITAEAIYEAEGTICTEPCYGFVSEDLATQILRHYILNYEMKEV